MAEIDFFGSLGLETEEQVLARKRREMAAEQAQQRQPATGNHQWAQNQGSMAGEALRRRFGVKVDANEKRRAEILSKSNNDMQAIESAFNRSGVVMTAADRSVRYKRILAENASAMGDGQLAAQISMAQYQEEKALIQQEMETKKLRADIANTEAETLNLQKGTPVKNTMKTVWPKGSSNPNDGIDLFIDQNGDARNNQGKVMYSMGEYTTAEPNRPPRDRSGSGKKELPDDINQWPEAARREHLKQSYSLNEQRGIREQGKAIYRLMKTGVDINALMEESKLINPNGEQGILDYIGHIKVTVGRYADLANGLSQAFHMENGSTYTALELVDGERDSGAKVSARLNGSEASAKAYVKNNMSDSDIQEVLINAGIGERFMKDKTLAAAFAANIVQLTYASMRAEEPGAKQFSDNDFKTNLKTSGGSASNPEEFRRVFMTKVRGAARQYDFEFSALPSWGEDIVIDRDTLNLIATARKQFESIYGSIYDEDENIAPAPGDVPMSSKPQAAPSTKQYKTEEDLLNDIGF